MYVIIKIKRSENKENFLRKPFQLYSLKDISADEKKRTKEWSIPIRAIKLPNSTMVSMSLYIPNSGFVRLRASISVPNIWNDAINTIIVNTLKIAFFNIICYPRLDMIFYDIFYPR